MTPNVALADWLARVGVLAGAPLMVSAEELAGWPGMLVTALKNHGMLMKTMPAQSVVCPGCERSCPMSVEVPIDKDGVAWPFVMCDGRSDISRVPVPVDMLERWKSSVELVANGLARLLESAVASPVDTAGRAWALGGVKGKMFRGRVNLTLDPGLVLEVAGQRVPLVDVLAIADERLALDFGTLEQMADHPMDNDGAETAEQRAVRLKARVAALRSAGVRGFRKVVCREEGISPTRLRQILGPVTPSKPKAAALDNVWGLAKPPKTKRNSTAKAKH